MLSTMTSNDAPASQSAAAANLSAGHEAAGLRITSAGGKVGFFVAGYVGLFCPGLFPALLFNFTVGAVIYVVLFLVWATLGTRCFRGDGEPVEPPRPWWKLTAKPTAGWILATLLFLQAVWVLTSSLAGPGAAGSVLVAAVYFIVAALFVHSSVRLRTSSPSSR
jgi:hypothetical protein